MELISPESAGSAGQQTNIERAESRSVRIKPSVWDRFDAAAKANNRSRPLQAGELIEQFVEEFERQAAA